MDLPLCNGCTENADKNGTQHAVLRCKGIVKESRNSTRSLVIPIETIVFKSFSFVFPGLTVAKVKGRLHQDARW